MKTLLVSLIFLTVANLAHAQRLTPLAQAPDWSQLNAFQETITREDFVFLLENVYAPGNAWVPTMTIGPDSASILTRKGSPPFVLRFAGSRAESAPVLRYWLPKAQIPKGEKPLSGVSIALDPGHIGGNWGKMEERWFQIGNSKPVLEGNMTLYVAKLLVPQLEELGAKVYLTRSSGSPVTSARPDKLRPSAVAALEDKQQLVTSESLKNESEKLFYRVSEIRRRAVLVNERIKPDIVLCLHFNAEAWGDPDKPALVDKNHLHFLVSGSFSKDELEYDDERFNMLTKLLNRVYSEELAVTTSIANAMSTITGLAPYHYETNQANRVGPNPYIWTRNLLANRLFDCPVVYVEPYVMNNSEVFARIQAGDYEGRKNFGGIPRKSIYREYADAIVEGLVHYYSSR